MFDIIIWKVINYHYSNQGSVPNEETNDQHPTPH